MDKFKAQDGTTISAILRPIIYKQETADVSTRMSSISSYQVFCNTLFSLRVTAFPHKSALRYSPRDKITHNAGKGCATVNNIQPGLHKNSKQNRCSITSPVCCVWYSYLDTLTNTVKDNTFFRNVGKTRH